MDSIAVMIADGEPLYRFGLRCALDCVDDLRIACEAANTAEVDNHSSDGDIDVLVIGLDLPGGALRIVRRLRESWPGLGIVALSRFEDTEWVRAALAAGVHGFVSKRDTAEHIVDAIRTVHRGRAWLSFRLPDDLRALVRGESAPKELPDREAEVLQMMALGFTYKVIGDRLGMSTKTVESYRSRICERLGLETRADLVRYCLETGLLQADLNNPSDS